MANPGNKNNPDTPAGEGSPQPRRAAKPPPAWSNIVRGESEPITESPAVVMDSSAPAPAAQVEETTTTTAAGEGSENGGGPNAGKKPAWKKPSNGAVVDVVGPVMGAESWPALSDAARASSSTKSLASESSKGVSDAPLSVSIAQGTGAAGISSPKQANSSSTPTHSGPSRPRTGKPRNNAHASSNGGLPQHQTSAGQGVEVPQNSPSPKEHTPRSAFGSQSQSSNDHPQRSNSFKNRNGGPHPRGDSSHHNNYNSRNQDRGSQDWSNHRNFNNRDNHMQPQRPVAPRGMRPHQVPVPPNVATFIPQPPMRPFAPVVGFDPFQPPLYYIQHPHQEPLGFMAPPRHPLMFPSPDLQLHTKIITQIDYYFSDENLIKDTYLRKNMDAQGWVPITLIAGFNKVMNLTENIQIILDAMRMSTIVEVQGDKIRRRNDWMKWVMPATQPPTVSGSQTFGMSGHDLLSAHIQNISLEERSTNSSNIQNSHLEPSNGDGAGGDHSGLTKN